MNSKHYAAGYRRAWASTRKPLDIEEASYEAKYGVDAATEFAEGWIDALEDA
jgi:hypothetical protein